MHSVFTAGVVVAVVIFVLGAIFVVLLFFFSFSLLLWIL